MKKDEKNIKYKRSEENKRGEKDKRNYYRNKINLVIWKSSGFKANIYYYIIYRYYQKLIVLR